MLSVATGIPVVAAEEIDLRTVDRRLRPSRCFVQLTLASARIPSSFVTWIFTNPKQLIIEGCTSDPSPRRRVGPDN